MTKGKPRSKEKVSSTKKSELKVEKLKKEVKEITTIEELKKERLERTGVETEIDNFLDTIEYELEGKNIGFERSLRYKTSEMFTNEIMEEIVNKSKKINLYEKAIEFSGLLLKQVEERKTKIDQEEVKVTEKELLTTIELIEKSNKWINND